MGDPNPEGVLLVPLGYSLMMAGGSAGLGTWLIEKESPWWSVGAGLIVGVLSYGLSEMLDGSSPFKTSSVP